MKRKKRNEKSTPDDFKSKPESATGKTASLAELIDLMINRKVSEFEGLGFSIKLHPTAFLPKPKPMDGNGKGEIPKPTALQKELAQLGLTEDTVSMLLNGGQVNG